MTEASHQSTPSTILHLGDRTLVVEATPLARSPQTRLGIIIDQPQASALCVKLPGVVLAVGRMLLGAVFVSITLPLILIGVTMVLFADPDPRDSRTWWPFVMLAVPAGCAAAGLLWLTTRKPRVEFSKTTGQLRSVFAGRLSGARIRVLAIQLLPGRVDEDLRGPGRSLQLNLILNNAALPRVGFITFRDADWTRAAARKLADYLGVPLVDHIPASE